MPIVNKPIYVCDQCNHEIPKSMAYQKPWGFIVHGNIYAAEEDGMGGIIGDNMKDIDDDSSDVDVIKQSIKKSILCRKCLAEILGLVEEET